MHYYLYSADMKKQYFLRKNVLQYPSKTNTEEIMQLQRKVIQNFDENYHEKERQCWHNKVLLIMGFGNWHGCNRIGDDIKPWENCWWDALSHASLLNIDKSQSQELKWFSEIDSDKGFGALYLLRIVIYLLLLLYFVYSLLL